MTQDPPGSTDFGFQQVPWRDKARRVRAVFDSVADRYDLMNDLMSAGAHRLWKQFTLSLTGLRPGDQALDIAGGTGDLAAGLARQVGKSRPGGAGRHQCQHAAAWPRSPDQPRFSRQSCSTCRPMPSNCRSPTAASTCVTIGFGLRNVTDKPAALASMRRAFKPGGQLLVLEFSKPVLPALGRLYDAYSFNLLPWLGRAVAGDAESYRYLAESIRRHPDQGALIELMKTAGLESCRYHNLSGGIVAVHRGYRY